MARGRLPNSHDQPDQPIKPRAEHFARSFLVATAGRLKPKTHSRDQPILSPFAVKFTLSTMNLVTFYFPNKPASCVHNVSVDCRFQFSTERGPRLLFRIARLDILGLLRSYVKLYE